MRRIALVFVVAAAFACGGRTESDVDDALIVASAIPGPLGVCENRIDYARGKTDETEISARFGYDAEGHIVRYVETSARGYAPLSVSRTYDDEGLLRTQDENLPRIAPARRHARWEYDDSARPIAITFHVEDVPPRSSLTTITYAADGRRLSTESKVDGVTSHVVRYSYLPGDPEVVEEAHDLSGDGTVDWTWRYGFAAGWVVFLESVRKGKVDAREVFTYSDLALGELATREFDHDGDGVIEDIDRFTWADHRIVRSTHTARELPTDFPQSFDYEYDVDGRLVKKTWATPRSTFITTFAWGVDGLERVARRDAKSSEYVERWAFSYGCPAGRPMVVRIAPVFDWQREIETMPFVLQRTRFWASFDVL